MCWSGCIPALQSCLSPLIDYSLRAFTTWLQETGVAVQDELFGSLRSLVLLSCLLGLFVAQCPFVRYLPVFNIKLPISKLPWNVDKETGLYQSIRA